jgi:hypothetical protein
MLKNVLTGFLKEEFNWFSYKYGYDGFLIYRSLDIAICEVYKA